MGWFWDTKSDNDPLNDPYKKLDPALREFLEKESPLKYEDTKPKPAIRQPATPSSAAVPPSNDAAPNTYRSQLPQIAGAHADNDADQGNRIVPKESLYQDGRYAHLWETYRSQSEVDAGGKTDQDRLKDVVDAYHERKAAIGRAAVENCVDFQIAEKDCFTSGSWSKRFTMCREENRAFNRCYTMQSRFLKALGYLSMQRSAEEEERIQMHADKLYHEMLERERVAKEAKESGIEVSAQPPLIQAETTTQALGEESAWARARRRAQGSGEGQLLSQFSPERQAEIRQKIEGLPKEERELELQLIAAESRAQVEYAQQIKHHLEEEKRSRADRRDRGRETFGDTIKRLWGWDK